MHGDIRIYHQNLIPLILKALLGNYRLRCYKLVNFKNKILDYQTNKTVNISEIFENCIL